MPTQNFRFETDADGIALVTWDMPGRSMNVIDAEVIGELSQIVDKIGSDEAIKGAVFTSGKEGFAAGADLTMLETAGAEFARRAKAEGKEATMRAFVDGTKQLSLVYRRLETCGKPVAAAINGVCMGGGFELALACHHRVVADADNARVGLPEIKVGLFPGAGGTQRVSRLMPTPDALQMLLKGDQIRPAAAKKMGLAHEVAPADQIVALAKAWELSNGEASALLGVSPSTLDRMKRGYRPTLSQDQLTRVSALVGIYKGLHLLFVDETADEWTRLPNRGPLFDRETPIQAMIEGGIPRMLDVRSYIDAVRGGL